GPGPWRAPGEGAGGRARLLAGLDTGPASAGHHPHPPHRSAGALHLLDQRLDAANDLLLPVPRPLSGVRVAQPLLCVPHLLDELTDRAAPRLVVGISLRSTPGQLRQAIVDLLVLAAQPGAVGLIGARGLAARILRLLAAAWCRPRAVLGRGRLPGLAQ